MHNELEVFLPCSKLLHPVISLKTPLWTHSMSLVPGCVVKLMVPPHNVLLTTQILFLLL